MYFSAIPVPIPCSNIHFSAIAKVTLWSKREYGCSNGFECKDPRTADGTTVTLGMPNTLKNHLALDRP